MSSGVSPHRVHVIACGVLGVDLRHVVKDIGLDVSLEFLPGGLHATPRELRKQLQEAIDRASRQQRGDVIAIGYGICGRGTVGLHARNVPLIVPRVNDCIALFLGSDATYHEQFRKFPGTYYVSAGWVEENATPLSQAEQADGDAAAEPPPDEEFERLVAEHGRENADAIRYFMNSWQRNYQRAAFIDTGAPGKRDRYAEIARRMAEGFGWEYEQLTGSGDLLIKMLKQRHTDSDILIVPPHHVTDYDPAGRTLTCRPVWQEAESTPAKRTIIAAAPDGPADPNERPVRLGLGIDAGGTYTDVVLYDFATATVLDKAKALTTNWDYTIGIEEALDGVDASRLGEVDLVAVSTTLATNAIVEGRGQPVGLLIMPPYGLYDHGDIPHSPIAVIDGQLEISGERRQPIDPDQVRRAAADMIANAQVGAFAVAGFASHDNPEHEQQVKAILRAEFGLAVTCGHEVSETLNYRVRAVTAALNARIIPCLDSLLLRAGESLARRGINAPSMVVCSNGSLMSMAMAHERPIETILSGPAASVAGASFLSKRPDAIVVDIGGTTTDTAVIRNDDVRVCPEGASVGGWRTHVKALDLRTLGLGGDSLIAWEKRKLQIGPRRVAPVAWLFADGDGHGKAPLDWLERHLDYYDDATGGMALASLNGHPDGLDLTDEERRIVKVLAERPHSLHELAERAGLVAWQFLPLSRLETHHAVQRCGLTPTDLLHATGQIDMWNTAAARRICELTAAVFGEDPDTLAERLLHEVVRKLAVELLKKQLAEETDADELDDSPVAMAMVANFLAGGTADYHIRAQFKRPVIGIGAPVAFFLPQAAQLLETECVIPPDADVANAIGAITSSVRIQRTVQIAPNEYGTYSVHGLPGNPTFPELDSATEFASEHLAELVRELAHQAGTSQADVEITIDDHVAEMAEEGRLFVGRMLEARITGRPDLARLVEPSAAK